MYKGSSVGVVIPAYNEAEFVGDVIDGVPDFVDRVFVVDDQSTDGTWAEIEDRAAELSATDSGGPPDRPAPPTVADGSGESPLGVAQSGKGRVVPVRHRTNRGRGGAVKTGYRLAARDGLDVVAVMDGDGQMDPEILDRIVDPVATGEAEYAKGNRLVSLDHCREMSGWRLFGNVLLTALTKVASGHWGMRDPQNGYTAISARALDAISVSDLYEDYGFLNDVLVRLNVHGLGVVDVPMRAVYGDETSDIRYTSFVPGLSVLLARRFLWRLWRKHLVRGTGEVLPGTRE